jgi:uncharacterized protein YcbK (DUF882 family)
VHTATIAAIESDLSALPESPVREADGANDVRRMNITELRRTKVAARRQGASLGRMRGRSTTSFLAVATVFAASGVLASPSPPTAIARPGARTFATTHLALATASREVRDPAGSWPSRLGGVVVWNRNTEERETIRLYDDAGGFDAGAARAFMRVARSREDSTPGRLDPRLVRLLFRASYHFGGATVAIVSGTRRGASGRHGSGEALDFSLEGVSAGALASFLRTTPRAGVGIYVHPKTQYVHLDVRDHSYHWVDASPPGVTWRERLLPDPTQAERDASYVPSLDLPEVAAAAR